MSEGLTYTFGDNDIAAERLGIVFEVFRPEMEALLRRAVTTPPALALDLGCGPGLTTRLVAESCPGATETIGIDTSASFLELARTLNADRPGIRFIQHDVTAIPFPAGRANLIFCHLLLTHLPDPEGAIAAWATQLAPGGLLIADEVEAITTGHPDLSAYLDVVAALVASRDGELYIGPRLAAMTSAPGLALVENTTAVLPVTAADAARMFIRNLTAWRTDPFIQRTYTRAALDALHTALAGLIATNDPTLITWTMRQMVWQA